MKQISDLAFFMELTRYGSLTNAAASFDVTPPAVSRRLAALEQRLGVRLLNRSTRRLGLTAEGEMYLRESALILQNIEELEESLMQGAQIPRGLLRVNATFGFGRRHVAQVLAEFAQQYPEVDVLLELTDHPLDLIAESFDVSVRFGVPPDSRLVARKVASNRRVLCASPDYLANAPKIFSPKDLTQHECLVIRQDLQAQSNWHLENGKQETTVKVRGRFTCNNGEVAVQWGLAGKGVLLRSEWDTKEFFDQGRLIRVLPDWQGSPADIYAVYSHRKNLSAKVRAFVECMRRYFDVGADEQADIH